MIEYWDVIYRVKTFSPQNPSDLHTFRKILLQIVLLKHIDNATTLLSNTISSLLSLNNRIFYLK